MTISSFNSSTRDPDEAWQKYHAQCSTAHQRSSGRAEASIPTSTRATVVDSLNEGEERNYPLDLDREEEERMNRWGRSAQRQRHRGRLGGAQMGIPNDDENDDGRKIEEIDSAPAKSTRQEDLSRRDDAQARLGRGSSPTDLSKERPDMSEPPARRESTPYPGSESARGRPSTPRLESHWVMWIPSGRPHSGPRRRHRRFPRRGNLQDRQRRGINGRLAGLLDQLGLRPGSRPADEVPLPVLVAICNLPLLIFILGVVFGVLVSFVRR